MLDSLLSSARAERPGHAALAYGEATLTFDEALRAAERLAVSAKLEPGERVGLVAPNVPALVVGLFAAWRAGAVAVPLNARLRRFELARALKDAEPAVVVSVPAHAGFALAEEIEHLAPDLPSLRLVVVIDELGDLVQVSGGQAHDPSPLSPPGLAAILYTSGTTGEPKGALVRHSLADAMAENVAELLGDDRDSPYGLVVPASHAFGLGCLLGGVAAGATAVLVDSTRSIDPLVGAMRRHRGVNLHGTPSLFARLVRSKDELPMRGGLVAGSWCPPELLEELDGRGARILNLYGMTEIGAAVSCRAEDPPEVRYHTVGRPLPGYEVRIAGEAPGEIQIRSDYLPSGYQGGDWGPDELADGDWFRTGDLGELDEAGNLRISGRAKDVIHVGGFNVFPAEVEAFLLTHPSIDAAAVIGVAHRVWGEAPQAFVVPARGAALEPRDVISFARTGIAGYKVPYAVQVVDELPTLASGKIDRRALSPEPEEAVR